MHTPSHEMPQETNRYSVYPKLQTLIAAQQQTLRQAAAESTGADTVAGYEYVPFAHEPVDTSAFGADKLEIQLIHTGSNVGYEPDIPVDSLAEPIRPGAKISLIFKATEGQDAIPVYLPGDLELATSRGISVNHVANGKKIGYAYKAWIGPEHPPFAVNTAFTDTVRDIQFEVFQKAKQNGEPLPPLLDEESELAQARELFGDGIIHELSDTECAVIYEATVASTKKLNVGEYLDATGQR